jgi:hypothetical protein
MAQRFAPIVSSTLACLCTFARGSESARFADFRGE